MTAAEHADRFVGALLGGSASDLRGVHTTLWTFPARETLWLPVSDPAAIASRAVSESLRQGRDAVYVSVGLALAVGDQRQRPVAYPRSEPDPKTGLFDVPVGGLTGVALDIDFAGPAHDGRKVYPPNAAAARRIIAAMGAPPSVEVLSGHGLQCWWLFPEPWIFGQVDVDHSGRPVIDEHTYEPERAAAIELFWSWVTTARIHASHLGGWHVDPTGDIARLLRVPGTKNRKLADDPRDVVVDVIRDVRYNPDDLQQWIADPAVLKDYRLSGTPETEGVFEGVDVHALWARVHSALYRRSGHIPPWFQAVLDLDDDIGGGRLADTFHGRRRDLDEDESSIDMSIGRQLADLNASAEQIAEVIMCRRLRSGVKIEKVDPTRRIDYLTRTIGRVLRSSLAAREEREQRAERAAVSVVRATDVADDMIAPSEDDPVAPPPPVRPVRVVEDLADEDPGPDDPDDDPDGGVPAPPPETPGTGDATAAIVERDEPVTPVERTLLGNLTGLLSLPDFYVIARVEVRRGEKHDEVRMWVHRGEGADPVRGLGEWPVDKLRATRWRPKTAWEKPGQVTGHLLHDLHLVCGVPAKGWRQEGLPLMYQVMREVKIGTPAAAVRTTMRDLLLRMPPVASFGEAHDSGSPWLVAEAPGAMAPTVAVPLSTLRRHMLQIGDSSGLTPEGIVSAAADAGCQIRNGLVVDEGHRTIRDSRTWIVVAPGMLTPGDWEAVRRLVNDREAAGNVRPLRGAG